MLKKSFYGFSLSLHIFARVLVGLGVNFIFLRTIFI